MSRRSAFLLLILAVPALGADWRQFRGTDTNGVAVGPGPEKVSPDKGATWTADLPGRGLSSPVIVGSRVFVTACTGVGPKHDRLHVLAFDAARGHKLWERTFWATFSANSHPKSNMAAPTPASDGKHLVAWFATNDVVGLDLDGNVLWIRSLTEENPGASDGRGLASSPVIANGTAVLLGDNQNNPFALGIDVATGETRWHVSRPRSMVWTTPVLLPGKTPADELVLLQCESKLSAIEPATGKEVWKVEQSFHPMASSLVAGGRLYVPGEKGLLAYELQGQSAPKLLWEKPKLNPDVASPLALGDRLYCLRGSILVTGDAKTGEVLGQLRLKGAFSSSPVSSGGLVYCFNEDGVGTVVRPGEKDGTILSTGDFKETILCTPALANGALYVRSDKHLWKIAAGS